MSAQIRSARSRYSGDPGLFDVIGKVVGGIGKIAGGAIGGLLSGGPIGAIGGAVSGLAGAIGVKSGGAAQAVPVSKATLPTVSGKNTFALPQASALPGTGLQIPTITPVGTSSAPSSGASIGANGQLCLRGYHLNKSEYFHKRLQMVVQPGTACVKNRRMNPLNPRAASRAMRRLDGFSRATKSVERMMIKLARKNAPRGSRGFSGRKSGGCGCRKR